MNETNRKKNKLISSQCWMLASCGSVQDDGVANKRPGQTRMVLSISRTQANTKHQRLLGGQDGSLTEWAMSASKVQTETGTALMKRSTKEKKAIYRRRRCALQSQELPLPAIEPSAQRTTVSRARIHWQGLGDHSHARSPLKSLWKWFWIDFYFCCCWYFCMGPLWRVSVHWAWSYPSGLSYIYICVSFLCAHEYGIECVVGGAVW